MEGQIKKVNVMLGGGRQMPNVIGLLHEQSDIGEVVLSRDQKDKFDELQNAVRILQQYKPPLLNKVLDLRCSDKPVDAFNFAEIVESCEQIIALYPQAEFIFNVTCATTVMSIAAFTVAQKYQCRAIYIDTVGGRVIDLALTPRIGSLKLLEIKLEIYLACYKRKMRFIQKINPVSLILWHVLLIWLMHCQRT